MIKEELVMVKDLNNFLATIVRSILENPKSLNSSKKFKNIGLSAREVLGIFLVCSVANYIDNSGWTIASDPEGYDGVIISNSGKRNGDGFATEQVYIPSFESGNLTDLVIERIERKSSRGSEYGKNRHLIVYCNKSGFIDHQKIKKKIKENTVFLSYWIIGKNMPDKFSYFVASPKTISDPTMAYEVVISDSFDDVRVKVLGNL